MARDPDPDFRGDVMYRRLKEEHVREGRVTRAAITLPKCCGNRRRYSPCPDDVLAGHEDYTLVATLQCDDLPLPVEGQGKAGPWRYTWHMEDLPEDGNEAHAAASVMQADDNYVADGEEEQIRPDKAQAALKRALAQRMRLLPPRP
jgi:hypothetical protein